MANNRTLYNLHYKARKAGCRLHTKSKTFSVASGTQIEQLPASAKKLVHRHHYLVQTIIE